MSDYPSTTLAMNKGKYYVLLTIPKDLRRHFGNRTQLKRSTGTTDKAVAKRKQHSIASDLYAKLDAAKPDPLQLTADILEISLGEAKELHEDGELEGFIQGRRHLPLHGGDLEEDYAISHIRQSGHEALSALRSVGVASSRVKGTASHPLLLSVAAEEYLKTEPYGKHKTTRDAELSLQQFIEHVGDLPLAGVTAIMVHDFAEAMGTDKSRETVAKKIGYVRRLFDFTVRKGWLSSSVFSGLKIDGKIGKPREHYRPFSKDELNNLFGLKMPDHLRLLLSILITTGMRLDEAALLDWHDVKNEDGITYFDLTRIDKIVKNKGSIRRVPVPDVLDLDATGKAGEIFHQFKRDKDGKAQSPASKALMKLVRQVTDERLKVVHSLRGNLKDLLRDAGVPKDTNDYLTGHGSGDVAGQYGSGPSLKVRAKALNKIHHPWLNLEE